MMIPLRRLASVTLGKMLQSDPSTDTDVSANYLRAAHVQPNGRRISFDDDQTMWFPRGELRGLDLRAGDVVIVEGGAGFGRSATVKQDMPGWGFQNSIVRLRPVRGIADGRFIDYALQSALEDGRIEVACSTATIPHFTAEKVAGFPIPVQPLTRQLAIADFLDRETAKIDALIDKQRSLIIGFSERRAAEVNRVLSTSPGVSGVPLRELATIQTGITIGGGDRGAEGKEYPYLRVANVQVGRVDITELATVSVPPEIARAATLRRGDVLMTEGGDRAALGRGSIWEAPVDPCLHQNHVFALRPRLDKLTPEFLVYVLEGEGARRYFESTRRQTTNLSSTNSRLVRAFRFRVPTVSEQRGITKRLDETTAIVISAIRTLERSVSLAKERRAALITAAVTGQLNIGGEA